MLVRFEPDGRPDGRGMPMTPRMGDVRTKGFSILATTRSSTRTAQTDRPGKASLSIIQCCADVR